MIQRTETRIPGVCLLDPRLFEDNRGFLMETYSLRDFAGVGIDRNFVQENHVLSRRQVLRGLHYQLRRPQAKLVRSIGGAVFDVAVDIRLGSPTFGQWTGDVLSAENRRIMFVPEGFAHGFYVLSEAAEVLYKCSDFYTPEDEYGFLWNDPRFAIDWRIAAGSVPLVSERDRRLPLLASLPMDKLPAYRDTVS